MSCGIPDVVILESPSVVDTEETDTLAFDPVPGGDKYILMYKFYWPGEDDIHSDRNEFNGDGLSPGSTTLKELGFVQFMTEPESDDNFFPVNSSDVTLTDVTSETQTQTQTVEINCDTGSLTTLRVTGGAAASLYRRVRERRREGEEGDKNVYARHFFSDGYDVLGLSLFPGVEDSLGSLTDEDGIDEDIYRLFTEDVYGADDEGGGYINGSLILAIAVYAKSYDPSTLSGIESVPVYLGTVEIPNDVWYY